MKLKRNPSVLREREREKKQRENKVFYYYFLKKNELPPKKIKIKKMPC
jgi:hypothetical protein